MSPVDSAQSGLFAAGQAQEGRPTVLGGGSVNTPPRLPDHRAVVVDQYPIWHVAIERVFDQIDVELVGAFTSGGPALAALDVTRPDILIVDPSFSTDGYQFVTEACRRVEGLRAIVLSEGSNFQEINAAFMAGASAYVVKRAAPEDFALAIRQAFDHSIFFAHRTRRPAPASPANACDLTPRELELLRLVASGHTNARLAKLLWITEQTVKFHLSNIYRKLGVANRTEAARWAQVNGLSDEFEKAEPEAASEAL